MLGSLNSKKDADNGGIHGLNKVWALENSLSMLEVVWA
jgi:hypothetical protein